MRERKKIGIVSLGYAWMPCEPGPSRFYYIAKILTENGYDVDLISSSFQHFKKQPRDIELIEKQNYPFHITFIDTPSYKRNIDIRRIYSNIIASKNVIKYLKENVKEYDAIYCSIPANNIAAKVSVFCKKNKIPFVVDIEDLWPEAMKMVIKQKFIRNIFLYPFKRDAEITYKNADGVIGTSDDYTNRAFKYNHRNIPHETVYVGCDLEVFDKGVEEYASSIEKADGEFWVTYAGSIGTSYDIKTMIKASKLLEDEGYTNIKIKILGTGPMKEELEELTSTLQCKNVEFLGYVPYPKMAAYLSRSDVLVNSFVKNAPQSIVNKIGDYLAAGKPMINTLENEEFERLVEREGFGINIIPENENILMQMIIRIQTDKKQYLKYSKSARILVEEKFDRKKAYLRITPIINHVIMEKGCKYEKN